MKGQWLVQVFGRRGDSSFEISIVRENNHHGRKSWGWFDANKLLVCHSGTSRVMLTESIWNWQIAIANEVCDKMNAEEAEIEAHMANVVSIADGYKISHE